MTVHGTGTSGPANPDTEELSPQSSEDAINKLEDQNNTPNVASENDAVKKEAAPDADDAENASSEPQHHHRTSCFFEWRLLPQHKISVIRDDPNVQALGEKGTWWRTEEDAYVEHLYWQPIQSEEQS